MTFAADTWLVFTRALRRSLRNPVWVSIGLMQPILYLALFNNSPRCCCSPGSCCR